MIIIGELINASRKAIGAAIKARDAEAIQKVARDEVEAGADYIDINAGIFINDEPQYLKWLVETVQEVVNVPCTIDSPNPKAIEAALKVHNGTPMINSISLEKDRFENEVKYYGLKGERNVLSSLGTGEKVPKFYGGNSIETLGSAGGWLATPSELMKLLVAIDGFTFRDDILSSESIEKMNKELNNGRLAMIGVLGMICQELVTDKSIFN